jgi:hypothetical protein
LNQLRFIAVDLWLFTPAPECGGADFVDPACDETSSGRGADMKLEVVPRNKRKRPDQLSITHKFGCLETKLVGN